MDNESVYYTPFSKSLRFLSISSIIILSVLYSIVYSKNQILLSQYKSIETEGEASFSILIHYNTYKKNGKTIHLYTYTTTGSFGIKTSITEEVDSKINLQLRVGDTIPTYKKSVRWLGKDILISRIKGNHADYPNLNFLDNFVLSGIILFSFLFLLSFIVK